MALLALRERRYEDAAKLISECLRLERRGADASLAVEIAYTRFVSRMKLPNYWREYGPAEA
ncbi:MAG: hypothetical protein WDO68_18545 [Gammaproteobacteria bacterium]